MTIIVILCALRAIIFLVLLYFNFDLIMAFLGSLVFGFIIVWVPEIVAKSKTAIYIFGPAYDYAIVYMLSLGLLVVLYLIAAKNREIGGLFFNTFYLFALFVGVVISLVRLFLVMRVSI